MGSVAIPSGGGGGNFGKIYYGGSTQVDSYGTIATCGVRATRTNTNPASVSNTGSRNIPLYHNSDNTKKGILTSVKLTANAYSHYNDTTSRGGASATVTLKTPSGTVLGSATKSSSGQNSQSQTVTVELLGKSAIIAEDCTYLVAYASTSASASVNPDNDNSWTDCSANVTVTEVKYMVED